MPRFPSALHHPCTPYCTVGHPKQVAPVCLQILALGCPPNENVQSYILFLNTFIKEFTRISRRLEDLQSVVRHLYPVYIQPVKDGAIDAKNAPALFKAFTPRYKEAVGRFTTGSNNLSHAARGQG